MLSALAMPVKPRGSFSLSCASELLPEPGSRLQCVLRQVCEWAFDRPDKGHVTADEITCAFCSVASTALSLRATQTGHHKSL